jgi:hypothetical protein
MREVRGGIAGSSADIPERWQEDELNSNIGLPVPVPSYSELAAQASRRARFMAEASTSRYINAHRIGSEAIAGAANQIGRNNSSVPIYTVSKLGDKVFVKTKSSN